MSSKKLREKPPQPKKIKSFQDALSFYQKTRVNLQQVIEEAKELSEELGVDQDHLNNDQVPAPLLINKSLNMPEVDMEGWLGTNLAYYSKVLESILPNVDQNMEVMPKLLEGLVKEAQSGTENLSKLLKRVQKQVSRKSPAPSPKELDMIEKELDKRIHKLNFFKEEVDERFESFKDCLVEYVSNYSLLVHILDCTRMMSNNPKSNIKRVVRRLTQFKNPL